MPDDPNVSHERRKFIPQHDRGTLRTCEREEDVGTG
jgi:hypothetical protein